MRFYSSILATSLVAAFVTTTLASVDKGLVEALEHRNVLSDGSACSELPGTYTCGDSSTLLVCIFNIWKFQSKCPAGTTCSDGMCISTLGSATQGTTTNSVANSPSSDSSSSTGSTTDSGASSISGDTTDSDSTYSSDIHTGDISSDSGDTSESGSSDNSDVTDESSDDLGEILNITTIDSSEEEDISKTATASNIIAQNRFNICLQVMVSVVAISFVSLV